MTQLEADSPRYVAVSGGSADRDDLWHVEDTELGQLAWFGDGDEQGARDMARDANAGTVTI